MPPSIWPSTDRGSIALPISCAIADPDDARQPELDVDLGDHLHRAGTECDMCTLTGDLARLRVERRCQRMPVHALDVDFPPPRASRSASAARHASRTAPETIHRLARRRSRAGRVDRGRRVRRQANVVDPQLGPRDLEDHVRHALTDFGGSAVDLRGAIVEEPNTCGAIIVESFGETEVLEACGKADAPANALTARGVAGAARKAERVAGQLLRRGRFERGGPADHLGDRKGSLDPLARGKRVSRR